MPPGDNADGVRRRNLSAILDLVHHGLAASRAELTAHTGLNRSTVAALVAELADLRLVEEGDPIASGGSVALPRGPAVRAPRRHRDQPRSGCRDGRARRPRRSRRAPHPPPAPRHPHPRRRRRGDPRHHRRPARHHRSTRHGRRTRDPGTRPGDRRRRALGPRTSDGGRSPSPSRSKTRSGCP